MPQELNETPRPPVKARDAVQHGGRPLNPNALLRQAQGVRKFQDMFLQGIVGVCALLLAEVFNVSADLFKELRRHDANEQVSDDVIQRLSTSQVVNRQAEIVLLIEAHAACQLTEEAKEMPPAAFVAGSLRAVASQ